MELNPQRLISPKPLPFFKFPRMDCLYKSLLNILEASGSVRVLVNSPATAVYPASTSRSNSSSSSRNEGTTAATAAAAGGGGGEKGVVVVGADGEEKCFDAVIMACHASTALKLIQEPSWVEKMLLGGVEYHPVQTIMHSDVDYMKR